MCTSKARRPNLQNEAGILPSNRGKMGDVEEINRQDISRQSLLFRMSQKLRRELFVVFQ